MGAKTSLPRQPILSNSLTNAPSGLPSIAFAATELHPDYLICTNTDDYPDCTKELARRARQVIACDGAAHHCRLRGITPDVIIGDLDSATDIDSKEVTVIARPSQYATDAQKALNYVAQQHHAPQARVVVVGLGGGRFDHSLYHVRLLKSFYRTFVQLDWLGKLDHCRVIDSPCRIINGWAARRISLFAPWGPARVTLPDAEFAVSDYPLSLDGDCSLSNSFTGKYFTLAQHQGAAVLCCVAHE